MDFDYIYYAEWAARIVMSVVIVLRRGSPSTALAWLVVVLAMPIVGTVAYVLVGENRLGRKSSRLHRSVVEKLSRALGRTISEAHVATSDLPPAMRLISNLAEGLGAKPPVGSNDLALVQEAEDLAAQLVSDIETAADHCHLLYYIFNVDSVGRRVGEALVRASGRGVQCRVLVDAVGSKVFLRSSLARDLQAAGVEVAGALPVNPFRAVFERLDLRNHRKLAIIDGRVGYVGSHNISEPLYPKKARFGAWVDASVRASGPAVRLLQELFIQDWCATGKQIELREELFPAVGDPRPGGIRVQILPSGPDQRDSPLERVILQALHVARERAVLTTPYFVPDEPLVDALTTAAKRGVDVSLVVPQKSDSLVAQAAGRSRYGDLLGAGLKIYEFRLGLLHAKTITIDGEFALIGTANLDIRSFLLNFEIALLVYDPDFVAQLHFLQQIYMEQSEPVTLEEWKRRGAFEIFADNVFKLMSPLL